MRKVKVIDVIAAYEEDIEIIDYVRSDASYFLKQCNKQCKKD